MFFVEGGVAHASQPKTLGLFHLVVILLSLAQLQAAEGLKWEQNQGFRSARLTIPAAGKIGFQKLEAANLGIHFTNDVSTVRAILNRNLLNGSGVALGDFDGDGWCDIYLCNLDGKNALYKNLGNWKFADVTDQAGVACPNQTSTGAVFCDLNGDGHLDVLVTSMGGPNA